MNPIIKTLCLMMIVAFTGCSISKKATKEREAMLENIEPQPKHITEQDIAHLPNVVKKWLKASCVIGKKHIHSAFVEQKLWMRLKPGQEGWHTGTANQVFTTEKPAFNWAMHMKMSPIMKIKGRDKFESGKGKMHIKMNAIINVAKERGPKIDEAAMQRYLGEIIWFPTAAIHPYIRWEAIDSLTAKATMNFGGTNGSGTFHFNEKGDLTKYAALRFQDNKPDAERVPWENEVKEIRTINGIRIPVKTETTWKLDDGDWTWLKLEITNIKYNIDAIDDVKKD